MIAIVPEVLIQFRAPLAVQLVRLRLHRRVRWFLEHIERKRPHVVAPLLAVAAVQPILASTSTSIPADPIASARRAAGRRLALGQVLADEALPSKLVILEVGLAVHQHRRHQLLHAPPGHLRNRELTRTLGVEPRTLHVRVERLWELRWLPADHLAVVRKVNPVVQHDARRLGLVVEYWDVPHRREVRLVRRRGGRRAPRIVEDRVRRAEREDGDRALVHRIQRWKAKGGPTT